MYVNIISIKICMYLICIDNRLSYKYTKDRQIKQSIKFSLIFNPVFILKLFIKYCIIHCLNSSKL